MAEIKKLPKREEVRKEDTWCLEDLFPTDEAWEQAVDELEEKIGYLKDYAGRMEESAEIMAECLQLTDEAENLYERILVYSNEKMHQDMGNAKYQGYAAKAQTEGARLSAAEAFLEPEVLAMPEEKMQQYFEKNKKLEQYK